MKLEYTDGCVCQSLTIDGKETIDMGPEELREALETALKNVTDVGFFQEILMSLVITQGERLSLGVCDECGDSIEKYTLEF